MHILVFIIGVITAISVWYWRMQMLGRAARDGADMAKAAANMPRKLRFQHKAGKGGLKLVNDPREAAAVIMLEIARASGEVSREHKEIMAARMADEFDMDPDEAEALVTHAAWLTREAPAPHVVVARMTDLLLKTPGIGPKEIVDLDDILVAVSEAEGQPSPEQLGLLQAYRNKAGVRT